MKKINLLRKSERKSVGTTLALTVGSPSAHRRDWRLKHLTFMLLFLLGSLNVWGADVTYTMNTSGSNSTTIEENWTANSSAAFNTSGAYWACGSTNNQFVITSGSGITGTITKVQVTGKRNKNKSYTIDVTVGGTALGTQFSKSGNATYDTEDAFTNSTGLSGTIVITVNAAGGTASSDKGSFWITEIVVTTADGGGSPTPLGQADNLVASSVTTSGATLSWDAVENASSYKLTIGDNVIENATSPYAAIGLEDNAEYTWSVQAIGDGVNYSTSDAVDGPNFTTLDDPSTDKVVYDFHSSATLYPDGFPTSGTNVASAEAFTIDGKSVIINAPTSYYIMNSTNDASRALFFGKTSAAYLEFPAKAGYKLTKMVVIAGANCGATKCNVYNTSSEAVSTQITASASATMTFAIATEKQVKNAAYRLQIDESKNLQVAYVSLFYEAVAPEAVEKPTISGETPFLTTTEVTLTQAEADAIYYTTDGSDPKTSGDKLTYSAPFTINADGTTTVKAYAVKGSDESDVTEKTFTKITPLTVAQALVEGAGSGKYVTGTITSITEVNIGYKNATYVISDISAGIPQNEMIVFRGKYIGGADFTSADQIHVGDVVVVSGSIAVHAEKNQMAQGNQIETISAAAVSAPVFDPNGGGFVVSTDVTIAAAGAEHIYYTTNGDNPTKASSEYIGAIHLDATTTIKVIAYIGEESSLVVEKTFTLTDPKTVAEAYDELVSADLENVAVEGIVYDLSISSGNATYWISDDGNAGAKVLEVFKGKGIGGADVAVGDIREGDKVIVFGTLTIYTGGSEDVKEFKQGGRLLSLTRKTVESVAVTGTPTKTNYKVGDAFDPAGLTVTVTYDDASHATVAVADCSWEKDPATFDAAGTGLSVNVKATYDGVQSPAYLVEGLTVKAVPTFDDPNYEWQLVTGASQLVAGKYYVLASASAGKTANKTITSGYLGTVASTIADGVIAYNALGENTAIFELGGESGAWTLVEAIEEKQLTGATTANFVWDGATNTTWPISIDGENAIIGASDGYRVLYNVNSPRFKPYNSATSASMVLPQLYVWALKTNKLRYDANGGENAPAAQAADGEGKATVTDAKPTKEDYVFKEWNTLVGGDGEAKAAGDVIDLSAGDVTLYAQWRTPDTYNISYDANGSTLIDGETALDPENVTEGNSYTVKANVYEVEGKIFMGWKAADVIYNAGQVIYPTEDMAFVAQWGDPTVTDFMLVTDVKQLKDGDKVYIVADGNYNMALGELNGSVRNPVEIAKSNAHIVNIGNNPVELTLGKDGNDYTFYDGANYLAWSSGNTLTNASSVSDNSTWNITINEGVTKIANKQDDTREIRYNSSSPRFAAYAGTQQHVSIYKRPDYSRDVTEGRYGTICLPKAGKIEGADIFEVAYMDYQGGHPYKIYFDEVLNGEMEAGMPYIVLPKNGASKLDVYYNDNAAVDAAAGHYNGLYGSYDRVNVPSNDGNYILLNNQYYFVNTDNVYCGANKAYIKLAGVPSYNPGQPAYGRRRIALGVQGENSATGVENGGLMNDEMVKKVLIEGQLFILRGEKMYDTTGQLVK